MASKVLLTLGVVLSVVVYTNAAISCYVCTALQSGCDGKSVTTLDTFKTSVGCSTSDRCYSVKESDAWVRGCTTQALCDADGSKFDCCTGDYCNNSNNIKMSVIALAATVVVAMLAK